MWGFLRGGSPVRAVVGVSRRLGGLDVDTARAILEAYGERPLDPAAARDWVIARGDLVVDEVGRTVYWGWDAQRSFRVPTGR